jgi:hypothetical protein
VHVGRELIFQHRHWEEKQKLNSLRMSLLILAVVSVLCISSCFSVQGYSQNETSVKIKDADNALTGAFAAVAQAEKAQANVTDLTLKLNEAATALAKANDAFRAGDYDNATVQAQLCINLVQGVVGEAQSLKADVEIARQNQLILTAAFSSIGLVALLGVGLFGWRYLKNRFVRNALKMKPEVIQA